MTKVKDSKIMNEFDVGHYQNVDDTVCKIKNRTSEVVGLKGMSQSEKQKHTEARKKEGRSAPGLHFDPVRSKTICHPTRDQREE